MRHFVGEQNELLAADYNADKLPKDKHSVKGCGQMAPDPSSHSVMYVSTLKTSSCSNSSSSSSCSNSSSSSSNSRKKKKVVSHPTVGGVILRLGALPEPWESDNTSEDLRRS